MTSSVNKVIIIQLILRSITANLSSLKVDLGFNLLSTSENWEFMLCVTYGKGQKESYLDTNETWVL